jgi:uracil-DNA glycosylase family 4
MHGANRSGRPFTGDHAGILLYRMLHEFGFGNRPESVSRDDPLRLSNCRITNAVKCLPPDNKPVGAEINTCNHFLRNELQGLPGESVVLALGGIAHKAVIRALQLRQVEFKFGHGELHELGNGIRLLDSYHCSRYNTNTGRLTEEMFREIFSKAESLLDP